MTDPERKIPFNYTSADDHKIINLLFGSDINAYIGSLEPNEETGRSSRHLYRFLGDLFMIERNSYLFTELVTRKHLRKKLFAAFEADLAAIEQRARHKEVDPVLSACFSALSALKEKVGAVIQNQRQLQRAFSPVVGKENVYLDPFSLTSHATDATDWRMCMPLAVVRPYKASQVGRLILKIKKLGLHIIPRGAGTGLTGGAIPLTSDCVMINTEKLNQMDPIRIETLQSGEKRASIRLEAGVITQDAMDAAALEGYVFATDPTSSWACTIGGNLSENAGGKKAVLYGTAIDNVLSYDIVMPDGSKYTVTRKNHPGRKTLPDDLVVFEIHTEEGSLHDTIEMPGSSLRKKGLGKDVTNKALNGLPGLQKEGCDGIITAATFILYPAFEFQKTVCIEFFGNDMSQASQVIQDICSAFEKKEPALMALEHFDEAYVKAIDYKAKTSAGNRLIAVLLLDMVAGDEQLISEGIGRIEKILEPFDRTAFKVAKDEAQAERFWQDRKRLGAIAAHTNSFKLNEDIVLPIERLAEFARFVDQHNLEENKFNQASTINKIVESLEKETPLSDPDMYKKRVGAAKDLAYRIRKKLEIASRDAIEAQIHLKNFMREVQESLRGFTKILGAILQVYEQENARRIVIATHMHAGDGNVHVNIPVLSNDRQMMQRANETADRVMEEAVRLDGVVSGEHGIGITKIKHLSEEKRLAFEQYRSTIDPDGLMNPSKLSDPNIMSKMFAPSFNLMDLEAKILHHGDMANLGKQTASCVRCGRCKADCPVFYPKKDLFFHPRNKNLSISSLIEAILYITQRTRSTGDEVLKHLEQIADHCTICHKCKIKCPVNIDTGEISVNERNILHRLSYKRTKVPTKLVLTYLAARNRAATSAMKKFGLRPGARLQKGGHLLADAAGRLVPSLKKNALFKLLDSPVTVPDPGTLSDAFAEKAGNEAILLEPVKQAVATVFYFPGCGSERIFSNISRGTVFLLLKAGIRVVLPPPNMCCSYPFQVNGKSGQYDDMTLENIIILTQIREMFQDLDFDACIVSCGTCMESLNRLDAHRIFESPVQDISGFVSEKLPDLQLPDNVMYHVPCHDSLDKGGSNLISSHTESGNVHKLSSCCSEAGTMALSCPDISVRMRHRKRGQIKTALTMTDTKQILTNCPSCVQGLNRNAGLGIKAVHLAEALAISAGGKTWQKQLPELIKSMHRVGF